MNILYNYLVSTKAYHLIEHILIIICYHLQISQRSKSLSKALFTHNQEIDNTQDTAIEEYLKCKSNPNTMWWSLGVVYTAFPLPTTFPKTKTLRLPYSSNTLSVTIKAAHIPRPELPEACMKNKFIEISIYNVWRRTGPRWKRL